MNKISRIWLVLALAAVLAGSLAFGAGNAAAANGTFRISVYHGINGKDLDLSKELPVIASVYRDGFLIANIPLEYKERFEADLPAGTYTIEVASVEAGPLPSMTVGPVSIPAGTEVRAQAQLDAGKIPVLKTRLDEGEAEATMDGFKISIYHGINGKALGLSRELPVIATVYKDGAFFANISLDYQERFTADLPPGTYRITVISEEAGPLPSMTVGPVSLPAGVEVRAQAQLGPGNTPRVSVKVK